MDQNDDAEKTQDQDLVDLLGAQQDERAATLTVIAGTQLGRLFRLAPGTTILGRMSTADVVVDGTGVSRRHAEIYSLDEGTAVIRDCGSTNGTLINGELLRNANRELTHGDKLQIGTSVVLRFAYSDRLDESFQEHLYNNAVRDALTRVHNKRYFFERAEQELASVVRTRKPLSVVLFDIDHFKQVNDSLGHPAGDAVLKAVAAAADGAMRREEVFARYGGEEFVVLLRESSLEDARGMAERLRKVISTVEVMWDDDIVRVTVSAGVASSEEDEDETTIEGLVERADERLYKAKRAGRDQVCSD